MTSFKSIIKKQITRCRDLENASLLDPDAENDLFALHYVFSGLLSKEIHTFVESWNRHQLRTEGNRTPLQMYIAGTIERHLPNNCFPELVKSCHVFSHNVLVLTIS
jgi:hypothetical protein